MQQYDCENFLGLGGDFLPGKEHSQYVNICLLFDSSMAQGDHEDEVSVSLFVLLPPRLHVPQLL